MTTALARRFKVDVSADNSTWLRFKGITDFNNQETGTVQPADTFDTNGFNQFEKTMTGAKVTVKALRQTTAGAYDPGQELVRTTRFGFGNAARVYVRWYDSTGGTEAYTALALVDWNPSKTSVADLDEITVTFTADGTVSAITNPYNVAVVPVITSITPSGVAVGGAVAIYGANFTGVVPTTGVKFGGTNATSFSFQNDGLITAVLPAGSAGTITVLVTNATGASVQTNNYVRGA